MGDLGSGADGSRRRGRTAENRLLAEGADRLSRRKDYAAQHFISLLDSGKGFLLNFSTLKKGIKIHVK